MIIRGWGGCICVLDDHFSDVMEHVAPQKNQQIYKKDTLRPPAGHGVTMLPCCSLWLLRCHKRSGTEASRRGKNWKSECRLDMIRMIENHRFLMFIFSPLKSKIESLRRRNANFHSWVTRLPIKMNVRPCCKHFWRLLQTPAFCILASKIRISNLSPLQGRRVNRLPSLAMFSSRFPPFFPIKKPGRAGRNRRPRRRTMNSSLPVPKASPSSSTSHAPVIGVGGWFFWTKKRKGW